MDRAIEALPSYTWTIFTSPNGVKAFFARLKVAGKDARHFGAGKVAAIGETTAATLAGAGIMADVVPEEFRAEAVVEALRGSVGAADRVLIPRAEQARDVLPAELAQARRRRRGCHGVSNCCRRSRWRIRRSAVD